ncbi:hypothetical protein EJ08DRAFT_695538 [Tothia fuscella]|uniref:RRM domain-containing protein n=1 Tax=Tothia fuscella TaxID=1048955 RepID=A0A9P4U0Y3_9PEZI|nr:hypothetical protein EJ08DRAFT_695538 [Tothia fuscella]
MTDQLPPNLKALFTPRPPVKYLPPSDHASEDRRTAHISGVAAFLPQLNEYKETDVYEPGESHHQRQMRLREEKRERHKALVANAPTNYNPTADPNVKGDAYKTLFVSRLDYSVDEKDLRAAFQSYGPIDSIRIVKNSDNGKARGYAFIVFEREKDMKGNSLHSQYFDNSTHQKAPNLIAHGQGLENSDARMPAYKETDGMNIKGRRAVVDVERGRTVTGWIPRRFGGGLGGRGYTKAHLPQQPGRGGPPAGPGGFRGGFQGGRGGFQGGRGGGFRGGFDGGRGGGGFRGDRGGFGGGGRGGFGGDRNGIGFQGNGFAPPNGAPAGPRGGGGAFRGGGGFQGGSGGGYSRDRPPFEDRRGGGGGMGGSGSGSNREPVGQRGSYRDRDREGGGGYGGSGGGRDDRKRGYDDEGSGGRDYKRRY